MRRVVTASIAFGVVLCALAVTQTTLAAEESGKADKPAAASADRIVVMYFHRTQRCPTCRRMGGYSEEAVVKGFPEQIKNGTVEFRYIDFQDEKNSALTKGYKIGGPSLIVAHIVGNQVKEAQNLSEIWTKVRDRDEFLKYVRDNVEKWLVAGG